MFFGSWSWENFFLGRHFWPEFLAQIRTHTWNDMKSDASGRAWNRDLGRYAFLDFTSRETNHNLLSKINQTFNRFHFYCSHFKFLKEFNFWKCPRASIIFMFLGSDGIQGNRIMLNASIKVPQQLPLNHRRWSIVFNI